MTDNPKEPPFEGGSQPVPEHPSEVPKGGQSVMQVVVVAIAVLAILAGLMWVLVPMMAR